MKKCPAQLTDIQYQSTSTSNSFIFFRYLPSFLLKSQELAGRFMNHFQNHHPDFLLLTVQETMFTHEVKLAVQTPNELSLRDGFVTCYIYNPKLPTHLGQLSTTEYVVDSTTFSSLL